MGRCFCSLLCISKVTSMIFLVYWSCDRNRVGKPGWMFQNPGFRVLIVLKAGYPGLTLWSKFSNGSDTRIHNY
jgi:hypothetical protein